MHTCTYYVKKKLGRNLALSLVLPVFFVNFFPYPSCQIKWRTNRERLGQNKGGEKSESSFAVFLLMLVSRRGGGVRSCPRAPSRFLALAACCKYVMRSKMSQICQKVHAGGRQALREKKSRETKKWEEKEWHSSQYFLTIEGIVCCVLKSEEARTKIQDLTN